jgi:hypothetical protein
VRVSLMPPSASSPGYRRLSSLQDAATPRTPTCGRHPCHTGPPPDRHSEAKTVTRTTITTAFGVIQTGFESGASVPEPMRTRGLEPPPGHPDTDLNRARRRQMRPSASRSSVSSWFRNASDASDDMTVAKVLPRIELRGVRQFVHGIDTDEDHVARAWRCRCV